MRYTQKALLAESGIKERKLEGEESRMARRQKKKYKDEDTVS